MEHWQNFVAAIHSRLGKVFPPCRGIERDKLPFLYQSIINYRFNFNKKKLEPLFAREQLSKFGNTFEGCYSPIRKNAVGLIIDVCNSYSWSYRCLLIGIKIMDNFLYESKRNIKTNDWRLIASACLMIACKFEESALIQFANVVEARKLIQTEKCVLVKLKYNLVFSTSDMFIDLLLDEYSKMMKARKLSNVRAELLDYRHEILQFELAATFNHNICLCDSSFVALCAIFATRRVFPIKNWLVWKFEMFAITQLNVKHYTLREINKYAGMLVLLATVHNKSILKYLSQYKAQRK